MNDKQKAKVQKYFDRGMKWEEISIITGVEVDDIKALCDTKPKTVAEQKKTIEAVTKKVTAAPKTTVTKPVYTPKATANPAPAAMSPKVGVTEE